MFSPQIHRRIYLVLLTLLGGTMVTSIGLSNVVWPLLLLNWVLEGRWSEKWQMAKTSRLLHAVAFLFIIHVVGLLWTTNLAQGFHVVERLLPWLVVPLVALTTKPPQGRARTIILSLYMGTVFVVTLIGLVRWLTIPHLPYRDIVPFISHVRFALNCCMVVFLSVAMATRAREPRRRWKVAAAVLMVVWMLAFLLLLRSYTAFVVLLLASLVASLCHRRRWLWLALWLVAVGSMATYVVVQYRDYYHLRPLALQPLPSHTAQGNPYHHKQDGFIEYGNYLYNHLCDEELRAQWPRRSRVPIDSITASGYNVEASLVRYLNALGLTKDSVGLAALTDSQIDEIGRGISTPDEGHGSLPKRMLHTLFFEYESYRCYHAVEGFSMLQRIELWKSAIHIIRQHPWAGTGTGDLADAMEEDLRASRSPLADNGLMPHNQYLTLTAQLGIPLLVLLALCFLRAVPRLRRQSTLMLLWVVTILVSCLTENTLESLAGILFSTWFTAFRHE